MNVLLSSTTEICLLTVLETGKFKSKDQQGLFSFEDSLSGLQTAASSLSPHMAFLLCAHGESQLSGESSSSYKAPGILDQGPTLMTALSI